MGHRLCAREASDDDGGVHTPRNDARMCGRQTIDLSNRAWWYNEIIPFHREGVFM